MCVEPILYAGTNRKLIRVITKEEVILKAAVFDLGGYKAPGPDGYSGVFFFSLFPPPLLFLQKHWSLIGIT